jgi:N-acetylglucosaminyldiphosphoundecaprenol N-acetyl-beta-D-mannosaminyltransferase
MIPQTQRPFGLKLSPDSAHQLARSAVLARPESGVSLVVTPNIDHIATIRRSPALAQAYRNAARVVCDGWPVQQYARMCGLPISRVTGCEITAELMRMAPYPAWHKLYFVIDSATTEHGVRMWAEQHGVVCETVVPPFGFERDAAYCQKLAAAITDFDTTILVMAVGAPRSEIFVDTYREMLPVCWAFCIGQAVKIELGLVQRASAGWQAVGMEWLWRLRQEPRRLAKRYTTAAVGFALAIAEDRLAGGLRTMRASQG